MDKVFKGPPSKEIKTCPLYSALYEEKHFPETQTKP